MNFKSTLFSSAVLYSQTVVAQGPFGNSTVQASVAPTEIAASSILSEAVTTTTGPTANAGEAWKTFLLPEVNCPAPTQQVYVDWINALADAADNVVGGVAGGNLEIGASSVADLICEFSNLVSPAVPVDAHGDLPAFAISSGRIAASLSDLSAKADTLTASLAARDLFARAEVTLPSYAESLASGVIMYVKLMSAAIESDSDCADRLSFSSLNDVMSTAVASLASQFSLLVEYPTAPNVGSCSSPTAPVSSGSLSGTPTAIPSSTCTPCPPEATDCVPCVPVVCETCPPVVCETCVPICTASPCAPVCPTCEVATTVVTEFTTYCPEPTTICTNNVCHTVTEATTLTITDCPCTIVTVVTPSPSPLVTIKTVITEETRTVKAPGAGAPAGTAVAPGGAPAGTAVASGGTVAGTAIAPGGTVAGTAIAPGGTNAPVVVGSSDSTGVVAANGASSFAANTMLVFAALFAFF